MGQEQRAKWLDELLASTRSAAEIQAEEEYHAEEAKQWEYTTWILVAIGVVIVFMSLPVVYYLYKKTRKISKKDRGGLGLNLPEVDVKAPEKEGEREKEHEQQVGDQKDAHAGKAGLDQQLKKHSVPTCLEQRTLMYTTAGLDFAPMSVSYVMPHSDECRMTEDEMTENRMQTDDEEPGDFDSDDDIGY